MQIGKMDKSSPIAARKRPSHSSGLSTFSFFSSDVPSSPSAEKASSSLSSVQRRGGDAELSSSSGSLVCPRISPPPD